MVFEQHGQMVQGISSQYPVLGLAIRTHRSTRGRPISFRNRPFLVELYANARKYEEMAWQKAVQIGASEWLLTTIFDAAGWCSPPKTCAYILPNNTIRNSFVQRRINPMLEKVPEYRARSPAGGFSEIGDEQAGTGKSMGLKHFGRGALMFLGSETVTNFVEFTADILVVDEYDRCNHENIALAGDRLRESPYPQRFFIGNPTIPGRGICREFLQSDGRRWHHRCSRCGERQPLDWFLNVVERGDDGRWLARDRAGAKAGHTRPVCRRCAQPFERVAEGGSWVAERPGYGRHGYQSSRLDVLSESLDKLIAEWIVAQGSPDKLRAFYRSVLGLGFEHEGARLTVEHLQRASEGNPTLDLMGGPIYAKQVVTAGIDVGGVHNIKISVVTRDPDGLPVRRGVYIGIVRTFKEINDLLRRFRVQIAVIDADPETTKAQELRDEFANAADVSCMVWLCRFYAHPRVGTQRYGMKLDYQTQLIQVDRSGAFDASHDDILSGRSLYPGDAFAVPFWSEQMRAPVRIFDEEKQRIIWDEGGEADHHRLADLYDRVACDLLDQGGSYFAG